MSRNPQNVMPTSLPTDLSDAFVANALKQAQWNTFLKNNRLDSIVLADVVTRMRGKIQKVRVV
jgi:hypothetical protein